MDYVFVVFVVSFIVDPGAARIVDKDPFPPTEQLSLIRNHCMSTVRRIQRLGDTNQCRILQNCVITHLVVGVVTIAVFTHGYGVQKQS